MYVIEMNQGRWLKGIWRGWLTLCGSRSGALIYQTLSKAEKARDFYKKLVPEARFTVRPWQGKSPEARENPRQKP
jgi:hypothetical protein